ncbi:hypothetical protein [Azotosporobacter soli]|uniref:hypothetical protein n=1 Tax=Azotosporobacter soli TaxID=3055040 RepID=UPI0031FE6BBA
MIFYVRKTLQSDLTPETVMGLLTNNLTDFSWQRAAFWEEQGALFHGRVRQNRFTITRSITGSQTFSPVIEGQVRATESGTRIDILLRPQFAAVGVAILFVIVIVYSILKESPSGLAQWLMPLSFVAIIAWAGIVSFKREVRRAELMLQDLFIRRKEEGDL